MLIPTIVLIYAVSLVIVIILAILIKVKDLAVYGTIPILNTLLLIAIITYAILSAYDIYEQKYKEKIPFYYFLNTRKQYEKKCMNLIKKIYTIMVLIKNLIFKKQYHKLSFFAEEDPPIKRWYYDFKYWGFSKDNLEMVAGADTLCELYSKGQNYVTVEIIATDKELQQYENDDYDKFIGKPFPNNTKLKDKILYGRDYTNVKTVIQNLKEQTIIKTMWICPVTLFVLGKYPNYIYIKNN